MNWEPYTLHFRQVFSNGFRYLDCCGAFILRAVEELGFLPGEAKPTGAQLVFPEKGMTAAVDAVTLELTQEGSAENSAEFGEIASKLSELALDLFEPAEVEDSSFNLKFYRAFAASEEAERSMLKFKGFSGDSELSQSFGMGIHSRKINTTFQSGPVRMHVGVYPVAIEEVRLVEFNPPINASASRVQKARRMTAKSHRLGKFPPYALFLEVLVEEREPAPSSVEQLYGYALAKAQVAKNIYKF